MKASALTRQVKGTTTLLLGANYIYELVPRSAGKCQIVLTQGQLGAQSLGALF